MNKFKISSIVLLIGNIFYIHSGSCCKCCRKPEQPIQDNFTKEEREPLLGNQKKYKTNEDIKLQNNITDSNIDEINNYKSELIRNSSHNDDIKEDDRPINPVNDVIDTKGIVREKNIKLDIIKEEYKEYEEDKSNIGSKRNKYRRLNTIKSVLRGLFSKDKNTDRIRSKTHDITIKRNNSLYRNYNENKNKNKNVNKGKKYSNNANKNKNYNKKIYIDNLDKNEFEERYNNIKKIKNNNDYYDCIDFYTSDFEKNIYNVTKYFELTKKPINISAHFRETDYETQSTIKKQQIKISRGRTIKDMFFGCVRNTVNDVKSNIKNRINKNKNKEDNNKNISICDNGRECMNEFEPRSLFPKGSNIINEFNKKGNEINNKKEKTSMFKGFLKKIPLFNKKK